MSEAPTAAARWSAVVVILIIAAVYAYVSFVLWALNVPGAGHKRKFYETGLVLLSGNVLGLIGGLAATFFGRLGLLLGLLIVLAAVPATFAAIFGVAATSSMFSAMFTLLLRGY